MRVELYANQRLVDAVKGRGKGVKRQRKDTYPEFGEDWSSMDESEGEEHKEVTLTAGSKAKKAKQGSAAGL